jgi:hypothetical protein
MRQTATLEPAKFVAICASLIPKDVQVSLSARLPGNLEADDWQIVMAVMEAVRTRGRHKYRDREGREGVAGRLYITDGNILECHQRNAL